MIRLTLLFGVLILLSSCSKSKEQVLAEQTQASMACDTSAHFQYMELFTPGDLLWDSQAYDKGKNMYRFTFENTTKVYCAPNSEGSVIATLAPFSFITLIREGIDPETDIKWYQIKFNNGLGDTYLGGVGYIKDENIDLGNTYTQFILGQNSVEETIYDQPGYRFKLVYTPREYSWQPISLSDTLSTVVNLAGIDYYNHFTIEDINTALKGEPKIVKIYWHHGESCPESDGNVFIAKSDNKLIELIQGFGTGEYGYEEYTKVYFPVKLNNGKTLLIENADVHNMFNEYNQTFNTFDYPSDCGIPIEELIVASEHEAQAKDDGQGNYVEDKNGNPIMETLYKKVRYYHWDGKNIKLAKEIIYKDRAENSNEN